MRFNQKDFGKRIQELRKKSQLTQEQLAEKLNTDRVCIARLEGGTRTCSFEMLVDIAELFEVSTDYLLLGLSSIETEKERLLDVIKQLGDIAKKL